ncbi:hypothetical protein [Primorskyibacter sp. S87]|uniref:bestrophin-like domain n=1 Tax=Primorskyibacter sp. S87 TaxID=3415126 RepID=UPI003C7B2B4F
MLGVTLTIAAIVLGVILFTCLSYYVAHVVAGRDIPQETRELAGSVVFRISALHGLILALIFAQQIQSFQQLQRTTIDEATSLVDIYFDIEHHGSDQKDAVRASLRSYLDRVLEFEWQSLALSGRLDPKAWQHWENIYLITLDLSATTPRQVSLRNSMLDDLATIADLRDKRESFSFATNLSAFWFAGVSGIVLVAIAYFAFTPTAINVALITIFGGYTGIVFFLIVSLSNPFAEPGALDPQALENLAANQFAMRTKATDGE